MQDLTLANMKTTAASLPRASRLFQATPVLAKKAGGRQVRGQILDAQEPSVGICAN